LQAGDKVVDKRRLFSRISIVPMSNTRSLHAPPRCIRFFFALYRECFLSNLAKGKTTTKLKNPIKSSKTQQTKNVVYRETLEKPKKEEKEREKNQTKPVCVKSELHNHRWEICKKNLYDRFVEGNSRT
jgi:hypothetical protein